MGSMWRALVVIGRLTRRFVIVGIVAAVWLAWWDRPLRPVATLATRTPPRNAQLAVTPSGRVAFLDTERRAIVVRDLLTSSEFAINVGEFCEFSVWGTWLKVLNEDSLDVYDAGSGKHLIRLPVGDPWWWLSWKMTHDLGAPAAGRIAHRNTDKSGQTLSIYDVATAQKLCTISKAGVPQYLSPDGQWLVTLDSDNEDLVAYDAGTGNEIDRLAAPANGQRDNLQILDDHRIAVFWTSSNQKPHRSFAIWEPGKGKAPMRWHDDRSNYPYQFLRQTCGGRLLFADTNGGIEIWDAVHGGAVAGPLPLHEVFPLRDGYTLANKELQPLDLGDMFNSCYVDAVDRSKVHRFSWANHVLWQDTPSGFAILVGEQAARSEAHWFWPAHPLAADQHDYLIGDLRTGEIVNRFTAGPQPFGQFVIQSPWLWQYWDDDGKVYVRQWPIRAPRPPWWLWLVTAIGTFALAGDIWRNLRKRILSPVAVA